MTIFGNHGSHLQTRAAENRLRSLAPRTGIDFASNDYLGLASSPVLTDAVRESLARGVPIGAGGSRLLRGNHVEHEALEAEAAAYFGAQSALFFSSGFAANVALLSTLPQRGDLIVHDELVHASCHEGMRLGRAEAIAVPHNDANAFESVAIKWRKAGNTGQIWIAVESLYSMEGDQAPLAALIDIARRNGAVLLIDEAHATGVFGTNGRGLACDLQGQENIITLHTCGKALGCEGALVCSPKIVRDFLINRGRGFIFSTAPSPLMASAVRAALKILADEPERRTRLQSLIANAGIALSQCNAAPTGSQIIPLIIGDDEQTMRVAAKLQAAGFDVRGIRPPTVPEGTSRLRISLTLNVTAQDVQALATAISDAM
jgi:8-amino-7-oxononanoate synthase